MAFKKSLKEVLQLFQHVKRNKLTSSLRTKRVVQKFGMSVLRTKKKKKDYKYFEYKFSPSAGLQINILSEYNKSVQLLKCVFSYFNATIYQTRNASLKNER